VVLQCKGLRPAKVNFIPLNAYFYCCVHAETTEILEGRVCFKAGMSGVINLLQAVYLSKQEK
jgi:hypothetical protein